MAGELPNIKLRRPWTVAVFSVVTLGVYYVVWYYKINREMRDYGEFRQDRELAESRPWLSVLAVTIGNVIVIPALISLVRTAKRVQAVEGIATGAAAPALGLYVALVVAELLPLGGAIHGLGTVLLLVGVAAFLVAITMIQARLNAVWRSDDDLVALTSDSAELVIGS
jgi:hypothetical protein